MKKRELTKNEKRIANKLNAILSGLDGYVFPDNPIAEVALVNARPGKGAGPLAYQPGNRRAKRKDCYVIFGYGIDKMMKKYQTRLQVLIWGQRKKKGKVKDVERFDKKKPLLEGIALTGLAAHEVRHRLQYHHAVKLIRRTRILLKSDRYLWVLRSIIEHFISNIKEFYKKNLKRYYAQEFDATLVQFIFMSLVNYGINTRSKKKAVEQMVAVLKIGQKQLCKNFLFKGITVFDPKD
ncbi:MAG: hypothetical protein V1928_05230 [Parcubacteria group bacterium]